MAIRGKRISALLIIGAIVAMMLLSTCDIFNIGLGDKVDIEAPSVAVTSVSTGSYVRGALALSGSCSDDIGVAGVTVRVGAGAAVPAVLAADKRSWSLGIDTAAQPDGQTELLIQATDASGKTGTGSVLVYIDNKAPTVLVSSPLSYGASARPQQSDNIDIMGEIYDASPIVRVSVAIRNPDGSVLAQKDADGTNSWTVRFDLKAQAGSAGTLLAGDDGKVYSYTVTATDRAGNASVYYYHRMDIYAILPAGHFFPAMDELGKLDQAGTGTAPVSGIDYTSLAARRLAAGATPAYADFSFKYLSLPDITFTSLDRDALQNANLLGIGARVTGLITPPAGFGAVDQGTIVVRLWNGNSASRSGLLTIRDTNPASTDDHIRVTTVGSAVSFEVFLENPAGVKLSPGPYYIEIDAAAQGTGLRTQPAEFIIDSSAPILTETLVGSSTQSRNAAFRLGGRALSAVDLNGGTVVVKRGFNDPNPASFVTVQTITLADLGSPYDIAWQSMDLPEGGLGDGNYFYAITLTTPSAKTASIDRSVVYDTSGPAVTINSIVPAPAPATGKVNGVLTFTAGITDANGIGEARWGVTASPTPPSWASLASNVLPGTYSASFDTHGYPDGATRLWIIARDKAGNESSANQTIDIDQASDSPTVALDAPWLVGGTAAQNRQGLGAKVNGAIVDDDSIDASTLAIQVDGGAWTPFGAYSDGKTLSFTYAFTGLAQGDHSFSLRVSDLASVKSGLPAATTTIGPVAFAYDTADPTISFTTTATWAGAAFSLQGTARDSNLLAAIDVSADGGSTWTNLWTGSAANADQAWSYAVPVGLFDGLHEGPRSYQLRATDAAGRIAVAGYSFGIDTIASDPTITAPAVGGQYSTSTVTALGTAADSGSGVVAVYWIIGGGSEPARPANPAVPADWTGLGWKAAAGATDWSANMTSVAEGSHTVYARSVDLAGNMSGGSVGRAFSVDLAPPTITLPLIDGGAMPAGAVYRGASFTLGATLSDSFDLASVTITQKLDAGSAVTIPFTTPASLSGATDTSAAFLAQNLPRNPAAPASLLLQSGSFEYEITLTDGAGKVTSYVKTVAVDIDDPTASITSPGAGDVVSSATLTATGAADDGTGSGVALVEYSLDGGATWAAANGTSSWNRSIALGAEGTKTLSVRARDAMGRYSAVVSRTFNLDTTPPSLTETGVGSGTQRRSSSFALAGQASDTNGLSTWDDPLIPGVDATPYVTVSVNGGAEVKVSVDLDGPDNNIATTADNNAWTYAYSYVSDQDVSFAIAAQDVVGKTTTITRLVSVDATAPVLSVDGVTAGMSGGSANGVITFRFSAADAGVGLARSGASYLAYYTIVADGSVIGTAAADIAGWTQLSSSNSNFSFNYDTTAIASGARDIYVGALDAVTGAPNGAYYMYDLPIDQNSDRPVLAFNNINAAAVIYTENGLGQNPTILVTVGDDDAVDVSLLQYRIDANGDGDFGESVDIWGGTANSAPDGDSTDKWENEATWYPMEVVPASDGQLAQAKIELVNFPQGKFGIQIRAKDTSAPADWTVYGNAANYGWKDSVDVPFFVDYGPPAISISAPAAGTFRADFPLTGTAIDPLGVSSVKYRMEAGGDSAYTTCYSGSATNVPINTTVDVSGLATGEYTLQIVATDLGGTSATQQIPITIDRAAPTVSFLEPSGSATVNGSSLLVRGEAQDNRLVGAVFVWCGLQSVDQGTVTLPSMTSPGVYAPGSYVQAAGASVWSLAIDTTAYGLSGGQPYRIRAVAVDAIGNVGAPVDLLETVDQASDRPVITFSNLSASAPFSRLGANARIIGVVEDDDSVDASTIQIRLDRNGDGDYLDASEGWVDVSDPPTGDSILASWYHDISDMVTQGARHVQVRSLDVNASAANRAVFAAHDLSSGLTGYGWSESPSITFTIDYGPPALAITTPVSGQQFTVNSFAVTGTTNDGNGVDYVSIWVDDDGDAVKDAGETTWIYDNGAGPVTTTDSATFAARGAGLYLTTDATVYTINQTISGLAASPVVKPVQVTSMDSAGGASVRDLTIITDTAAPTVSFNTPASGATVNGSVSVQGLASDNYQLAHVYYAVGASAPAYPGAGWTLATGTYSWSFGLDTVAQGDGSFNIYAIAVDTAGNASAPTSRPIVIDQASDRPVVDVLTLNEGGTAVQNLLPGSLQVSGTIQDDDAVKVSSIQIRVDVNNDGDYADGVTYPAEDWNAISGPPASDSAMAIWSHTFTGLTDGRYRFQVRAADIYDAGYGTYSSGSTVNVAFSVDLSLPTSTIASPTQGGIYRSDVTIAGTASDASGIKAVSIAYNTGSGYGGEATLYSNASAPNVSQAWTATRLASAGDGQVTFRITVTDAFDKQRTYEQIFTMDTVVPTAAFTQPAAASTVNGSLLIRGTASDSSDLSQVWIKVNNAAGPGTWAYPADPAANGWTLATGTYSWSYRLSTATLSDGAAMAYVMVIDNATAGGNGGNRSDPTLAANQIAFTVDQASNLPAISFTTANNALLDGTSFITGTVTDDDGINASTIQISFDSTDGTDGNWDSVSNPGTNGLSVNWSHSLSTLPERASPYTVWVRAYDVGEGANFPAVPGVSASLTIRKDDSAPAVSISQISVADRYGGAARVIASGFNGSYVNDDLSISFSASDTSGIASVAVSLDGGATWPLADASAPYAIPVTVPLDQSWDGTRSIAYRATDAVGKTTAGTITLIVDTLEPVVSFTSPTLTTSVLSDAPNVNGSVTVLGSVTDASAITGVAIAGGNSYDVALTNAGNNLAWNVSLNSATYAFASYATDQGSNVWRFPLRVTTYDCAGNRTVAVGYMDIDPDSDRPVVTIVSPPDLGSVAGVFLVNGTVTDDDGAQSVRVQLDVNNDGDYLDTYDFNSNGNSNDAWESEASYQTVTVTNGAWSLLLNSSGEFNRSYLAAHGIPAATGYIGMRVTPLDIYGTSGVAQTRVVYIDSDAPVIKGLASDGTTEVNYPTPATNSLLRQSITIRALFRDDMALDAASMQVSLDGGSTYANIGNVPGATISGDVDASSAYAYRIAIPVDTTAAVAGGNGTLTAILKVTDRTYKQSSYTLNYSVDNTRPEVMWNLPASIPYTGTIPSEVYYFNGDLVAADRVNQVFGKAIDSGLVAGIDHIDVYFVKGGNFYDPRTGATTPTANSALYRSGLDRNGNGDYLDANEYAPAGSTTSVPYTTDANFVMRINSRTELGQFDTNPTLGDQDGIDESLKAKTGYDEWSAFFDTTRLPDGPISVYFVAYDDVGNMSYNVAAAQVQNLPPSISTVSINGSALSAAPWKFRNVKAAGIPFVITAADPGSVQVDPAGWNLQVLGEYGNSSDVGAQTGSTAWNYGTSSTGTWTGTFTVDLTDVRFRAGYWYLMQATTTDVDGNIALRQFYLRTVTSDTNPPAITMNAIGPASVSVWTSKTTPLSLDVAAANLSSGNSVVSKALPPWLGTGTAVMWAGSNIPGGFAQNTIYYVRDLVVNTSFALSATYGGPAINVSGTPSGTYWLVAGGHVEAAGGSLLSARAAVSGAIQLSGQVSDDFDVQSLTIAFNGGAADPVTITNKTGDPITGYTYDWTYLWDTSRIMVGANNVVAQTDVLIDLLATDTGTNTVHKTDVSVDVAPFITSIADPTGLPGSVLRGSNGAYTIASSTNRMNVYGYNLGRTGYVPTAWNGKTVTSYTAAGTTASIGTGSTPALVPDATFPVNLIAVPKNWTRSGYFTVTVNTVPSINNLDNDANNSEASPSSPTTAKWTDNRFLWVWATTQIVPTSITTTSVNPALMTYYNPEMIVNPTGDVPEFAFNDDNGGILAYTVSDSAAVRKSGYRKMAQAGFAATTVNGVYTRFFASAFDSAYMTGDNTGIFEVLGWGGLQTGDNYNQNYGPSVPADNAPMWMTIQGNDYYSNSYTTTGGNYRYLNRFPHPKLLAAASPNSTAWARIWLCYYDASPYGQGLNYVSFSYQNAMSAAGGRNGYTTANIGTFATGPSKNAAVIEIPGTSGGRSSSAFGMVRVGTTGIAVAYYDPSASSLKLATSPAAYASTASTATDNITTLGTTNRREVSTLTFSTGTLASYVGKYFTLYNGTIPCDVWFDTTGSDAKPAGSGAAKSIRVNITGLSTADTIGNALNVALRTNSTVLDFRHTAVQTIAAQNITASEFLNSTNASTGNLLSAPAVVTAGGVTVATQGASNWSTITVDSGANVGNYVSIASDGVNLYMAYQDVDNGQLKFARVPWDGTGSPLAGNVRIAKVDGAPTVPIALGSWTNIMMLNLGSVTGVSKAEPVIAYYADSFNGTKNPIRFAVPKFDAADNLVALQDGVNADDSYTGSWEIMTVQAIGIPTGGDDRFNRVQLQPYSSGTLPVLGWVTTKPEYSKLMPDN